MKTILKAVAHGERVTIMNRKQPVADLVPPQPKLKERKFGMFAHLNLLVDPHALDPMTDDQVERFLEMGDY